MLAQTQQAITILKDKPLQTRQKNILLGTRIPKDYFVTKGKGESDITIHAGSYHLALKDAGIERYNIITYSSILPGIARQVARPKIQTHGAVMETIMAVAHAKKGEKATAGIITGWLFNKKTGEKYGGLVCEHNGNYTLKEIEDKLRASINELYTNGFSEEYTLEDIRVMMQSMTPKKEYGTSMVAICFTNYLYPVIS